MRDKEQGGEKRVDEALEGYLKRTRLKRRLRQASVVPEWAELVGEEIAKVTTPHHVTRDGVLIVSVKSASWMQELQLMSPEILRKLGAHGKGIRRIVWRAE
ncbi:MAG: DciA family protein [Gemmatimonadales bacterium]